MRTPSPALALLSLLLLFLAAGACAPSGEARPEHTVRIIASHPHDPNAFTEGLFYHEGKLYESTGQYGQSTVRITDLDSGRVLTLHRLDANTFGEGLAKLGSTAVQLTWKAETGLLYDLTTLEPLSTFRYQGEGWGLASSQHGLVMSNGSSTLTFLDAHTLKPTRSVRVMEGSTEVAQLNELEWYGPMILANVWMRDLLVAIDPADGNVLGRIDLAPLRPQLPKDAGVANGIAYDAATDRLFVTGKNWNKLFEVRITPALPQP